MREGVKGFYKSFGLLLLRDTPSYALYFCIFEFFKQNAKKPDIFNDIMIELVGGGLAGQSQLECDST